LTALGKKVTASRSDNSDEMKVLQFLRENKTSTSDELDTVGELWMVRRLRDRGLIKELTT